MHRVLSLQTARGFGESSEFVTKRMCFSFLFSVGFVCVLCGFLLGRFAAERHMEYRAEKKRLELAGNGLESGEHLLHFLLRELDAASFAGDYAANPEASVGQDNRVDSIKDIVANFSFFRTVVRNNSCVLATAHGSREPDRYVVLSASGRGVGVALELARLLDRVHVDNDWKSRRTLVFCMFSGTTDPCPGMLPVFAQRRIVGYLAVHGDRLQGKNVRVSGSDMLQSVVLQTSGAVRDTSDVKHYYKTIPARLRLGVPHVVFASSKENVSFATDMQYEKNTRHNDKILAQIISRTMWTLSESIILSWDPKYFYNSITDALDSVRESEFQGVIEDLRRVLDQLMSGADVLYQRTTTMELNKPLEIRMFNDLLVEVDRALLCPDSRSESKTDLATFATLRRTSSNLISTYLNEMLKCYEEAVQILDYL